MGAGSGDEQANSVWSGVVTMTEERYTDLAKLAGADLLVCCPYPVAMGERSGDETKGVYVAINRSGLACYVGQTRPTDGLAEAVAARLAQHARSPSKRDAWVEFWVFPLRRTTTRERVAQLEREICARLGLSVRNKRWKARERAAYRTATSPEVPGLDNH